MCQRNHSKGRDAVALRRGLRCLYIVLRPDPQSSLIQHTSPTMQHPARSFMCVQCCHPNRYKSWRTFVFACHEGCDGFLHTRGKKKRISTLPVDIPIVSPSGTGGSCQERHKYLRRAAEPPLSSDLMPAGRKARPDTRGMAQQGWIIHNALACH